MQKFWDNSASAVGVTDRAPAHIRASVTFGGVQIAPATVLGAATRAGVRKALAVLVLEGEMTVADRPVNQRDHPVRLRRAA